MKTALAAVLAAVLAGALGFWGGVTYQKSQTPTGFAGRAGNAQGMQGNGAMQPPDGFVPGQGAPGQGGQQGNAQGNVRRFAGGVATGTVLAVDAKSITVKLADGGSKTVFISSSTQFGKQETIKAADINVGDNVMAMGESTTGGITARSVQIVPEGSDFRLGFGF